MIFRSFIAANNSFNEACAISSACNESSRETRLVILTSPALAKASAAATAVVGAVEAEKVYWDGDSSEGSGMVSTTLFTVFRVRGVCVKAAIILVCLGCLRRDSVRVKTFLVRFIDLSTWW